MDKLKVAILSDDIDFRVKIKDLLNADDVILAGYIGYDENTLLKITGLSPNILIVTYYENDANAFEMCNKVYCSLPGCAIIMLSYDISVDIITKAMSNGVRQVLSINTSQKDLLDSIERVSLLEKNRFGDTNNKAIKNNCKVISFFGGKGGTGKTTIAVNTAVALAKEGRKVLVLDLDLQFGDVNLHLDLEPKETISELVEENHQFNIDMIKGYTMLHSSGVNVLCAPKSPQYAEYVTADHVERIINIVRPYFEYVIVDLAPMFNDISIAALENSDNTYLVFNNDISSLKNARLCVNILESLQQKDKTRVIINGVVDSIIKAKDFEQTLGISVLGTVTQDTKMAVSSLNKGVPMLLTNPRLQICKEILNIVNKMK